MRYGWESNFMGDQGIQHRSETGYYLGSYIGYSERHRPTSASGGMTTWLLEALLVAGVVDHVICVSPTSDSAKLFAFQVFDTPEDVRIGAGSAYYPVEMSGVIRQVLEIPGRYAITACPVLSRQLACPTAEQKARETDRCHCRLSLWAVKSRHFIDYVATLAEVQGKSDRGA